MGKNVSFIANDSRNASLQQVFIVSEKQNVLCFRRLKICNKILKPCFIYKCLLKYLGGATIMCIFASDFRVMWNMKCELV